MADMFGRRRDFEPGIQQPSERTAASRAIAIAAGIAGTLAAVKVGISSQAGREFVTAVRNLSRTVRIRSETITQAFDQKAAIQAATRAQSRQPVSFAASAYDTLANKAGKYYERLKVLGEIASGKQPIIHEVPQVVKALHQAKIAAGSAVDNKKTRADHHYFDWLRRRVSRIEEFRKAPQLSIIDRLARRATGQRNDTLRPATLDDYISYLEKQGVSKTQKIITGGENIDLRPGAPKPTFISLNDLYKFKKVAGKRTVYLGDKQFFDTSSQKFVDLRQSSLRRLMGEAIKVGEKLTTIPIVQFSPLQMVMPREMSAWYGSSQPYVARSGEDFFIRMGRRTSLGVKTASKYNLAGKSRTKIAAELKVKGYRYPCPRCATKGQRNNFSSRVNEGACLRCNGTGIDPYAFPEIGHPVKVFDTKKLGKTSILTPESTGIGRGVDMAKGYGPGVVASWDDLPYTMSGLERTSVKIKKEIDGKIVETTQEYWGRSGTSVGGSALVPGEPTVFARRTAKFMEGLYKTTGVDWRQQRQSPIPLVAIETVNRALGHGKHMPRFVKTPAGPRIGGFIEASPRELATGTANWFANRPGDILNYMGIGGWDESKFRHPGHIAAASVKRLGLIWAGVQAVRYGDYQIEKHSGFSPIKAAASIFAGADIVRRSIFTGWADAAEAISPGSMTSPASYALRTLGPIIGGIMAVRFTKNPIYGWGGLAAGILLSGDPTVGPGEAYDIYTGQQNIPIRKGRWWALSNSSFFGEETMMYRPHWIARILKDANYKGYPYANKEQYWQTQLSFPVPENWMGLRPWLRPYEHDEYIQRYAPTHFSSPFPISELPIIGPLLRPLAQAVKPVRRMDEGRAFSDEIEMVTGPMRVIDGDTVDTALNGAKRRIRLARADAYEMAHPLGFGDLAKRATQQFVNEEPTYAVASTRPDAYSRQVADLRQIYSGRSLREMLIEKGLTTGKFEQLSVTRLPFESSREAAGRARLLEIGGRLNLQLEEAGLATFGMNAALPYDGGAGRLLRFAEEMPGLYGWAFFSGSRSLLGLDESQQVRYETTAAITSMTSNFWGEQLGGLFGMTEHTRRLFPKQRYAEEDISLLTNDMPKWFPAAGDLQGQDFRTGIPYTKVPTGHLVMPGPAYEAFHPELRGVPYEDYPDPYKLQILASTSAHSTKARELSEIVSHSLSEGYYDDDKTLKHVAERALIEFEGITGQSPFRGLEDADTGFLTAGLMLRSNKLKDKPGALTSYIDNRLLGFELESWEEPIDTILRPAWRRAAQDGPMEGAIKGGFMGALFGGNPLARVVTAAIGAAAGARSGGVQASYFEDTGEMWAPQSTLAAWDIENYLDKLRFVKATSLYQITGAPAFAEAAKRTMHGVNPYGQPWEVIAAAPEADRPYLQAFMQVEDPEQRERVLQATPEHLDRLLVGQWTRHDWANNRLGWVNHFRAESRMLAAEKEQEQRLSGDTAQLQKFFSSGNRYLPEPDWSGWALDVPIEAAAVNVIENEGLATEQFGIWASERARFERMRSRPVLPDIGTPNMLGSFDVRSRLKKLLQPGQRQIYSNQILNGLPTSQEYSMDVVNYRDVRAIVRYGF